jgi:hypothetical protein
VLRLSGRLVFLEHGLSDDPRVQKALVGSQPFDDIRVDRFEMEGVPRTHGTMYRGVATK